MKNVVLTIVILLVVSSLFGQGFLSKYTGVQIETILDYSDGVIPGTAYANKALILSNLKAISGISEMDIENDITLGGTLYLENQYLYLDYNSPTGDRDIFVYFGNDGNNTENYFVLDDSENRYSFTLSLYTSGNYISANNHWIGLGSTTARIVFNNDGYVIITSALLRRTTTAGITASTTQSQGNGALTTDINEISVCANVNDTVTLPTAIAGLEIFIINNGAQTARIYPASSDDLGAGANNPTTLIAGANVTFVAYDTTNWETK